jgi:hypothetical protein
MRVTDIRISRILALFCLGFCSGLSPLAMASIPRGSQMPSKAETKLEIDKKLRAQYFQPLHDSDLPSDVAPVNLEGARSAFIDQAMFYQENLNKAREQSFTACTASWLEGSEVARPEAAPLTVSLMQKVPRWLGPPQVIYSSDIPLKTPLAVLVSSGKLTPSELQALDRLRTTEVEDVADRAQLSIDTETFLIRVTSRLYDGAIELLQQNSQEVLAAALERNQQLCTVSNLKVEKYQQLLEADKRALAFYDSLTQEMHHAHLF